LKKVRVAWGITGAGDYLQESLEAMRSASGEMDLEVTVLLSKNAQIVVKWYGLLREIESSFDSVRFERGPNQPFVAGPLQVGHYRLFFVSPSTANTTAKIVCGIADTLITNCVSQAVKGGTPVYIYPVDQEPGSIETEIPGGKTISIRTRKVDLDNAAKLADMEGITVLKKPGDILPILDSLS